MSDNDELDIAVRRLAALPSPGPSLVDQLGDAHAEIKRLRERVEDLERGLNIIAQAGSMYGGGWCVAQARGHLESLDFDMWPATGKAPEGCEYPECECVFRDGARDCLHREMEAVR